MSRAGWRIGAGLVAAILVLGLAVRLQPWSEVFVDGRDGARFIGDTDTYYHVLRAERIAAGAPGAPWRDDGMNYPLGADVLWPPLFDVAIAAGARLLPGPPTRVAFEISGAILPPILGVATVAALLAVGAVLVGRRAALAAGVVFALLPAHVESSVVGRPDQHVAELLLQTLAMLAFAAAWLGAANASARRALAASLGVAFALAFWTWQGSVLHVALLAAFVAVWHVLDGDGRLARRAHETLALGAGVAAALLAVSIEVAGRPGALASSSLSGINGIQAVLAAATAAFAAGLRVAARPRPTAGSAARRVVEVVVAAAVPLAVAWALLPGLREGVEQGWLALTAGNPWYASIREFQPILFGGRGIRGDLAAWIPRFAPMFVMPLAAVVLARRWREDPEARPALALLLFWGIALLVPTLLRLRFALYLSVPASLWAGAAAAALAGRRDRPRRGARPGRAAFAAGLVVLLAPALFYFSHGGLKRDPTEDEVAAALEWLRDRPLADPSRPAVFSEWDWGHLIQYHAGRPAVATPFGTDGGDGAMEDAAVFFLTRSASEAARILGARRAGTLLLVDPVTHAAAADDWAPAGLRSPVTVTWDRVRGPSISATPEVDDLVAVRVYYDSGLSSRGLPTLDHYRLVYEGAPAETRQVRLFEVVPGAEIEVRGAAPGAAVHAAVGLRTNRGRETTWRATAVADANGLAVVRVPFSSGANGAVAAGAYRLACGEHIATVEVPAAAVEGGGRVVADCGARHGDG